MNELAKKGWNKYFVAVGYMGFRDLIPCRNIDGLSSGLENQTFTKHSLLLAGGLNVPVTLDKLQLKSLI